MELMEREPEAIRRLGVLQLWLSGVRAVAGPAVGGSRKSQPRRAAAAADRPPATEGQRP